MSINNIPKAELHVHLEGAIDVMLAQALARKNAVNVPAARVAGSCYHWAGFVDFLQAFDEIGACVQSGADYRAIAYAYLKQRALAGTVYVEMMVSPDHADQQGISYEDMLSGLVSACEEAEADHGIVGRLIITCVRHKGAARAMWVAEQMRANLHPLVVGFGMGGDEHAYTFADFRPAYDLAFDLGLGLTVHAGEVCGPESVHQALTDLPKISRLGHGVRVVEDDRLLRLCISNGIHFEVCPTSNTALGVAPDYQRHPLHALRAAGARFSLNSDDPPFFGTSLEAEYRVGHQHFGLEAADLQAVTCMALEDSFSVEGRAMASEIRTFDRESE